MSTSLYIVDASREPGRVCLAAGQVWPVVQSKVNAVEVTFVAGYGLAADMPQDLKSAQLLLLGHLYENREAVTLRTIATTLLPLIQFCGSAIGGFMGESFFGFGFQIPEFDRHVIAP